MAERDDDGQVPFLDITVAQSVYQLLMGMPMSMALQEAVRLGLADRLQDKSQRVDVLANELKVDANKLLLLLRTLASMDIFEEVEEETFAQTARSTYLRADLVGSMSSLARMLGSPWTRNAWERLALTLETGQPSFEYIYQTDFWTYLFEHAEAYTIFSQAMTPFTESINAAITEAYDFSDVGTLVDVGGGRGSVLMTLLKRYPSLQGLLLDQPSVIEEAHVTFDHAGLAQRCICLAGDFFEGVPVGADTYLLKQVLSNWGDELCIALLSNCYKAMSSSGKVLVVEYVVPRPHSKPSPYLFIALWMSLYMPGGYERTEERFRSLFHQAGLELVQVWSTSSTHSLLEARKA